MSVAEKFHTTILTKANVGTISTMIAIRVEMESSWYGYIRFWSSQKNPRMKGVSDVNLFRESNSAIIDAANIQMIHCRYHIWQIEGDNEFLNCFFLSVFYMYFFCLFCIVFMQISIFLFIINDQSSYLMQTNLNSDITILTEG